MRLPVHAWGEFTPRHAPRDVARASRPKVLTETPGCHGAAGLPPLGRLCGALARSASGVLPPWRVPARFSRPSPVGCPSVPHSRSGQEAVWPPGCPAPRAPARSVIVVRVGVLAGEPPVPQNRWSRSDEPRPRSVPGRGRIQEWLRVRWPGIETCGARAKGADSHSDDRGRVGVLAAGVRTLSLLSGGVPSVLRLQFRTWVRLRRLRGAPGTRLRGPRSRAP